ncbi:hypothetical protein C8R45DRAFT_948157 [Mycena sanguinolenta]|nr:hypothetical protein C8R45DRAFT_948157 [Mycena sanguinolenta]
MIHRRQIERWLRYKTRQTASQNGKPYTWNLNKNAAGLGFHPRHRPLRVAPKVPTTISTAFPIPLLRRRGAHIPPILLFQLSIHRGRRSAGRTEIHEQPQIGACRQDRAQRFNGCEGVECKAADFKPRYRVVRWESKDAEMDVEEASADSRKGDDTCGITKKKPRRSRTLRDNGVDVVWGHVWTVPANSFRTYTHASADYSSRETSISVGCPSHLTPMLVSGATNLHNVNRPLGGDEMRRGHPSELEGFLLQFRGQKNARSIVCIEHG